MSPRTTGLLLLVTLGLSAFVYFYEIRGEPAREAAADAERQLFSGLTAEEVRTIEIAGPEGTRARATRAAGAWRLSEPVDAPADSASLEAMARALVAMRSEGRIEDPAEPGVYGLGETALAVSFESGEDRHRVRFGRETPVGSNVYVGLGEPDALEVHMIGSVHAVSFDRMGDELRDSRLLDVKPADVQRLTVSAPGFAATLERRDGDWTIVAPGPLGADRSAVERLLSDLSLLRAEFFVDDPDASEREVLATPDFEAVLVGEGGAELGRLVLGSKSASPAGLRLARGREGQVVRVRAALVEHLPRRLFTLRYKQIARFDPNDVRELEVRFADGEPLRLTRSDSEAGWTGPDGDVRDLAPDAIVKRLERLDATDIVADALGPEERASFGLEPARLRLIVRGEPTEEDAGGTLLADVRIGAQSLVRGPLALSGEREEIYRLDVNFDSALPPDRASFELALALDDAVPEAAEPDGD
jgi:hypothetical protein